MDRKDFEDYQKIGPRISALQDRISKLEEMEGAYGYGVVKGSAAEFPYQPRNFHVSGYNIQKEERRTRKIRELKEKLQAELEEERARRLEVEDFINGIQDRTDNLIFTYYYLDRMSQGEVARKLCMDRSRVSRRISKYFS